MKYALWILVLLLIILHQDYWNWGRADIVFGFIPFTVAYQILVSVVTAIVWIIAVNLCWPENVDDIKPINRPRPLSELKKGSKLK